MITATADAAATTTDPLMLVLLSGIGGVFLTVAAGLFGAWLQSRREHKKWIRERRYEAFVAAMTLLRAYESAKFTEGKRDPDKPMSEAAVVRNEGLFDRHTEATALLATLGPDSVADSVTALLRDIATGADAEKIKVQKRQVLEAIRASLGIRA